MFLYLYLLPSLPNRRKYDPFLGPVVFELSWFNLIHGRPSSRFDQSSRRCWFQIMVHVSNRHDFQSVVSHPPLLTCLFTDQTGYGGRSVVAVDMARRLRRRQTDPPRCGLPAATARRQPCTCPAKSSNTRLRRRRPDWSTSVRRAGNNGDANHAHALQTAATAHRRGLDQKRDLHHWICFKHK
jgi:hypothetical protein